MPLLSHILPYYGTILWLLPILRAMLEMKSKLLRAIVEEENGLLKEAGIGGVHALGSASKPVYQIVDWLIFSNLRTFGSSRVDIHDAP